ncbi:MAG: glycosyltransferase [Candidatus Andersenbacteria bacterium]
MKLLLFTSVKAVHSQKWIRSLVALPSQQKSGLEIHVATFSVAPEDRIPGVTYHELIPSTKSIQNDKTLPVRQAQSTIASEAWLTFKNGLKFAKRFAEVIQNVAPDMVHAHQSVPFGWYAVRGLARSRVKVPLIVSVWGTDVLAYAEQHWLFRLMNYSVLKHATLLCATSLALVRAAQRWTRNPRWLVIPFGVDPRLFRQKKNVAERARVFGMAKQLKFIGTLDVYGFETALAALKLASQKKSDLILEIAGSGPKEHYLKKRAQELGVAERVRFLGQVQPQALAQVMTRWDALLLPSRQESFGVAAVEAAAVGIPVIGARVGGVPEIVREGHTGRLLAPCTPERLAEAMLHVDASLLKSAHTIGPQLVRERFSWDQSVQRMLRVYTVLTERGA